MAGESRLRRRNDFFAQILRMDDVKRVALIAVLCIALLCVKARALQTPITPSSTPPTPQPTPQPSPSPSPSPAEHTTTPIVRRFATEAPEATEANIAFTMKPSQTHCLRSLKVVHKRILCLGDSLTQGTYLTSKRKMRHHPYGAALQQALGEGWIVEYQGYAGWTTGDISRSLESIVADKIKGRLFDGVILLSGANDILKTTAASLEIAHSSVRLADQLKELITYSWVIHLKNPLMIPAARPKHRKLQKDTFYCTSGGLTNRRIREVNRAMEGLVQGCRLWDPFDALSRTRDLGRIWFDCIHPSPEGSDRLGQLLAERLKEMVYIDEEERKARLKENNIEVFDVILAENKLAAER